MSLGNRREVIFRDDQDRARDWLGWRRSSRRKVGRIKNSGNQEMAAAAQAKRPGHCSSGAPVWNWCRLVHCVRRLGESASLTLRGQGIRSRPVNAHRQPPTDRSETPGRLCPFGAEHHAAPGKRTALLNGRSLCLLRFASVANIRNRTPLRQNKLKNNCQPSLPGPYLAHDQFN
jgi:hypothetical protein